MALYPEDLDSQTQRTFDLMRPLLVRACKPIAASFAEIKQRYDINVDSAELEINFSFNAEGTPYLTNSKQQSSITVKLHLSPEQDKPM